MQTPNLMQPKMQISRNQFKKMVMPNVGDHIVGGLFRVEYVNYAQFRFSASWKTVKPDLGAVLKVEDRLFKINKIDENKKWFTTSFQGFEEKYKEVPEAPTESEDNLVKLI